MTPGMNITPLRTGPAPSWQPFTAARSSPTVQKHSHQPEPQSVLRIIEQPPVEVRTRTPGENRTFCVKAQLNDPQRCVRFVHVTLCFADDTGPRKPLSILGGTT